MGKMRMIAWLVCGSGILCSCGSTALSTDAGTENDAATGMGAMTDAATTSDASTGNDATAQSAVLMISSGLRFATPSLVVAAGASVTIENQDSLPHTVTSEAAPNAFTPSGDFDTGPIAAGKTATITIPATATSGTVFYYYCSIHASLMSPANGTITVQ